MFCLFVLVEALHPSQQFFSHVWTFSWVEPVLSNEDEVSCSRTQHYTPAIEEFGTLPTELRVHPIDVHVFDIIFIKKIIKGRFESSK